MVVMGEAVGTGTVALIVVPPSVAIAFASNVGVFDHQPFTGGAAHRAPLRNTTTRASFAAATTRGGRVSVSTSIPNAAAIAAT